ncbi:hypothetical protein NPIL_264551, partial [Nephila pilipes]
GSESVGVKRKEDQQASRSLSAAQRAAFLFNGGATGQATAGSESFGRF